MPSMMPTTPRGVHEFRQPWHPAGALAPDRLPAPTGRLPPSRFRVIEAAHWIVGHAGWRALTNPAYVALLVVLTVALVGGATPSVSSPSVRSSPWLCRW